jgi:hypothetical protein
LRSLPAREQEFRWFDGRPVILHVLTGAGQGEVRP